MQTTAHTTAVEQMLESADHLIEHHRGDRSSFDYYTGPPQLPEGWILYSASYELGRDGQGWNVEVMDTTKPFQKGSIVESKHRETLDAALMEARYKIGAGKRPGRS